MSLDGYIAKKNDDISWLSIVEKEGEDYGYNAFIKTVDTYIVGRKTYEVILKLTGGEFPQSTMFDNCYIITRKKQENTNKLTFYNGDIEKLVAKLKSKPGKNIFCDGGSEIVNLLMKKNLIDEYIISIIPIILGDGIRLFKQKLEDFKINLKNCVNFDSGLVQLHYTKD